MSNPALLFLDTDALIQLYISGTAKVLPGLKTQFGIQPVVMPEVEIEVASSRKFGSRVHPILKKAIAVRSVVVMDEAGYLAQLKANQDLQTSSVGLSYAQIQQLGQQYSRRVDRGEAYTFAGAVSLKQPMVSNDWSAIQTMMQAGWQLPANVLRAYDLIVFGHQSGLLTLKDCENARSTLLLEKEFLPGNQKSQSFEDGLQTFAPRLVDDSKPVLGRALANPPFPFSVPINVKPLAKS